MSVTSTASSATFIGDNVSDDFDLPFRVLESDDLLVRTTDDDGETFTTLVLDDDYTLAGVGPDDGTSTPEGVTLTLTGGALALGTDLVVERTTDPTQETQFQPQGNFSPITVSRIGDKNTLLIQELLRRVAALESLGDLVDVADVANGVVIGDELVITDPVEGFFPVQIPCANGSAADFVVWKVRSAGNDAPTWTTPEVQWVAGPGANITIEHIDGLQPGESYTVAGLVLFT